MLLYKIENQKNYIIRPGRLWDGSAGQLADNAYLTVKGGLIDQVIFGTGQPTPAEEHRDFIEINLPELTLMPGLIDCHVHLAFDSENLQRTINEWSANPDNTWARIKKWMTSSLNSGVTIVRDGGDLLQFNLQAGNLQAEGQLTGPKIVATGSAIYKKGKYGSFLGPGISSLAEAEEQIDNLIRQGIDQLKVVVSGLVSFKDYGSVGKTQFSVEELSSIVGLSHRRGLKVMAHASSDEAVATCVKAGVDSVEHGYFVSSESLKRMAAAGTAWIPTIAPLGNLVRSGHVPYPGADMEVIRRSCEQQLAAVNLARNLGVRLGVGTDAGANHVWHGSSYIDELKFYREAGLEPWEVLISASAGSAEIVGIKGGKLERGKIPSIIGVRGNPLEDISSLENVEFVAYV